MPLEIEGTQATGTDLFDDEAGLTVMNTEDVEEMSSYLQVFRMVQDQMCSLDGLPICVVQAVREVQYFQLATRRARKA